MGLKQTYVLICLLVFILSNQEKAGAMMINQPPIKMHLGESGNQFVKSNAAPIRINRQPAGLNFYDIDWKATTPGQVTIGNGGKDILSIADVLHVSATEDVDFRGDGLAQITVTAQLSGTEFIGHELALHKINFLLESIRAAGWRTYIPRRQPRIRGRHLLEYVLHTDEFASLDSAFSPTSLEWMSLGTSAHWTFRSNNSYLVFSFTRDSAYMDPTKPGVYLINYMLRTEGEHLRSLVQSEDRIRWTQAIHPHIVSMTRERASVETMLKAKRIPIDETYQNPPVPKN